MTAPTNPTQPIDQAQADAARQVDNIFGWLGLIFLLEGYLASALIHFDDITIRFLCFLTINFIGVILGISAYSTTMGKGTILIAASAFLGCSPVFWFMTLLISRFKTG